MTSNQHGRAERGWLHGRIACGLFVGLAIASSVAATPSLDFFPNSVRALSVTPNGCAVFFSVSHETAPWMSHVVPRVVPMVDGDGDGVVNYLANSNLVEKSIWAVVDATTGDVTVDAPDGYTPQEVLINPYTLIQAGEKLIDSREQLEILIVRPGVGAWHRRIQDGGPADEGLESDGMVMTSVGALNLIWSATNKPPTLKNVKAGDLVVGIDPVSMVYYQLEISLFQGS